MNTAVLTTISSTIETPIGDLHQRPERSPAKDSSSDVYLLLRYGWAHRTSATLNYP
jgi:hypothetical protein